MEQWTIENVKFIEWSNDSVFGTRKWNIVNDQSNACTKYDVWNEIICNTEVLKSNFCDYSDAYI